MFILVVFLYMFMEGVCAHVHISKMEGQRLSFDHWDCILQVREKHLNSNVGVFSCVCNCVLCCDLARESFMNVSGSLVACV